MTMKQSKPQTATKPHPAPWRKIDPGEKVDRLMTFAENVAAGKAKLRRSRIDRLTTDEALVIILTWRYAGVLNRVDDRLIDAVLERIQFD